MTFLIFILAVVYFVPAIIAGFNGSNKFAGIVVLNIFLGWTLLGWIGALIWAVSSSSSE